MAAEGINSKGTRKVQRRGGDKQSQLVHQQCSLSSNMMAPLMCYVYCMCRGYRVKGHQEGAKQEQGGRGSSCACAKCSCAKSASAESTCCKGTCTRSCTRPCTFCSSNECTKGYQEELELDAQYPLTSREQQSHSLRRERPKCAAAAAHMHAL